MVLIFSANANESPQVRREVERAISKRLTVLPFRVEDVRPIGAMEYALSNTHWLDAFTPPVERQMAMLAESVRSLLRKERVAVVPDSRPPVPPPRLRGLVLAVCVGGLALLGVGLWKWYDAKSDTAIAPRKDPPHESPLRSDQPSWPLVLYRAMAADLKTSESAKRSRLRYLTLAHTPGQPESRREAIRLGLAELARWWSTPEREVHFAPINEERQVYRINLVLISPSPNDFWDAVLRADPHALRYRKSDDRELRESAEDVERLAQTEVAHVWADWFIVQVKRWVLDNSPLLHRSQAPLPQGLEQLKQQYEVTTLSLDEAAREIGLTEGARLRRFLESDAAHQSVSLQPLLVGQRVSRWTWESFEDAVSPFQYVSSGLDLGTPHH